MSGKSEGTIPSNEYVYFNNVVLQTYTTAHKNKIHYKTSAASGESPKWLKTKKNISDTLHRHYFEGLISRQRKQWSAGFIKRFQWMTIKPKRRFVSSRFHIWSYIKKRGLPFQEEELPANIWSPSSDMHIANTKPLPSSEATPGMLRPVSKLPQAFKSITHTSNKHTARATEYRAASYLVCLTLFERSTGVRKVTRPRRARETMALVTVLTAIWCQSRPATAARRWAHREAGQEVCFSWLDTDSSLHRAWVQRKRLVDSTVVSHTTAAVSSNPGRDDTMMAQCRSSEYGFKSLWDFGDCWKKTFFITRTEAERALLFFRLPI